MACRYGGEELAIILNDTPIQGARAVAERIRTQLRELEFSPRGQTVRVTASFGVAEALGVALRTADVRPSALLVAADEALYRAKHEGRDCVRLYGSERTASVRPDSALRVAFPPASQTGA